MNALTMLNDVDDLFEHSLEHGWSFAMVRYPHFTASPNPALVTTDEDGNMWAAGWGEAPGDDRTRHMVIDAEDLTFPLEMIWHDALPPAEVGSLARAGLGRLLEVAWDEGNATGLDGWVGPGRGAGAIDPEAVQARTRTVNKLLEKYCPEEATS